MASLASCIHRRSCLLAAVALLLMAFKLEGSQGAHDPPSTSTPAAVEYWEKVLPTVPLPAELLKRVSPLDSSMVANYRQMISSSRVAQPSMSSLCNTARLYCSAQKFKAFRQSVSSCGIKFGFRKAVLQTMASTGSFFRESALVEGSVLVIRDQRASTPTTSFLPRQLADMLHPASAELLQTAFNISASSLLAKESMNTSQALCKTDPEDLLPGEEAFCAYSLEDLADELKARVSSSVLQLLPVSRSSANIRPAKLLKLRLEAQGTQPYLSCHPQTYPFAVHFCHHVSNTRIYTATLQSTQASSEIIHAVAICHMDTANWSPDHVAFADLYSTPGHTEACHWTHDNGLIFVAIKN